MLQNPQVASMLTPFHHAAAMQAAALHHAAASQNNASAVGVQPPESSIFNTSLNVPHSMFTGIIRVHSEFELRSSRKHGTKCPYTSSPVFKSICLRLRRNNSSS